MKVNYFPILIILLIGVVVISGCTTNLNSSGTGQEQIAQSTHQYKDSSTFLLSLEDLPQNENWTVTERGERNVNDVASVALEYNWSGGYYIRFSSAQNEKITYIEQYLSIYPEDKILGILNNHLSDEEPLINPSIGENSRAVKIRTTVLGQDIIIYKILFVKNNILVSLQSWGTSTDYLELKELAQKAYDKVDGYGKPFDYQALKPTSKTYTNNLYGFSIVQPSKWNTNENTQYIVEFESPLVSGESALIGVSVHDISISFFDTDTNREIFIDALKKGTNNFVLIENKSLTINGKKAYSFTFVNTISSGENKAAQQVYIERNDNQVFRVAYVANSKQFDNYNDVFVETLNSFNVK